MSNLQGAFKLPPDITMRKERLTYGWAYVVRHSDWGELGRILLQGRSDGRTHVTAEIVGDADDPMTAQRRAIFEPLSQEMIHLLAIATGGTGNEPAVAPLPHPPAPPQSVPCKLMQCEHCGTPVALLIFADHATDRGGLEDCARLMYQKVIALNVPTWVIGPFLAGNKLPLEQPALTLQIWPERQPLRQVSPQEFNPMLDALMANHCRGEQSAD